MLLSLSLPGWPGRLMVPLRLVSPTLQGAWGDVHILADLGGRPASVLLLDQHTVTTPGVAGCAEVAGHGHPF